MSIRKDEVPVPEGATPFSIDVEAPPARDDFNEIKRTLLNEDGTVRDVRPKSLDPCGVCGTVHEPGKFPICLCVKCKSMGQIVWCGQCMQCAWKRHAEEAGEEVADAIFPNYGTWRKKEAERLREKGLPWDQ